MEKSKIKMQYKRIAKKLKTTQKAVALFADKAKEIAEEGAQYAKKILSLAIESPTFTQKHGEKLVNEIGVSQFSSNGYKIYAPISGDEEIKYEMFFAEYGAGLGASEAKFSATGAVSLNYVPTKIKDDGTWAYPLVEPTKTLNKKGELKTYYYNITNTSEAVNFMYLAREQMAMKMQKAITDCEKTMKGKFIKISGQIKTSTSITRPKG